MYIFIVRTGNNPYHNTLFIVGSDFDILIRILLDLLTKSCSDLESALLHVVAACFYGLSRAGKCSYFLLDQTNARLCCR